MSPQEKVIQAAVNKALSNGWEHEALNSDTHTSLDISTEWGRLYSHPKEFIFNKDFAKALFGEELILTAGVVDQHTMKRVSIYRTAYLAFLQDMVIADDPIKYLGKVL
jgi:hypothetical protein